jgi:hypothetical protein
MRKLQLFLSEFDKNSVEFTEITSLKDYFFFFTIKMTGTARNVEYNFLDILLSLEFTTCGGVLSFMVILSFMVHHMLRVNISIAIVEMQSKMSLTVLKTMDRDMIGLQLKRTTFWVPTFGATLSPKSQVAVLQKGLDQKSLWVLDYCQQVF